MHRKERVAVVRLSRQRNHIQFGDFLPAAVRTADEYEQEKPDDEEYSRPDQQSFVRAFAESQQGKTKQGVKTQDIANPKDGGVQNAQSKQHPQSARIKRADIPALCFGTRHLDGESQSKKKREDGVELALGKEEHRDFCKFIVPGQFGRDITREENRGGEPADVDRQNAEDSKSAQDVEDVNSLSLGNRVDVIVRRGVGHWQLPEVR